MPRAGARKHQIRRRFQRIRHEIQAYSVPRQGVRRRRTQAEAMAEYAGAQAALRYRAAQRAKLRRPPPRVQRIKRAKPKRPWWSWLILDYKGFQQDRRRR